jgi:hypothetical protein
MVALDRLFSWMKENSEKNIKGQRKSWQHLCTLMKIPIGITKRVFILDGSFPDKPHFELLGKIPHVSYPK